MPSGVTPRICSDRQNCTLQYPLSTTIPFMMPPASRLCDRGVCACGASSDTVSMNTRPGMDRTTHRTSVLIPCYNESAGIPQLCERLKALRVALDHSEDLEIIFVDDGSTDGTGDVIAGCMSGIPHEVVRHASNRGIGAALRTGFYAAHGEELVTTDSDCTYDPSTIPQILNQLRSGYDVVTASPYHPQGEVVGVEAWRLLLSRALSRVYGLVLPGRLYTYTSCYRAYRRDALERMTLHNDGFLGVTELLVSGMLHGMKVGEMPVRLTRRRFGTSKIRILTVSFAHARYILQILWSRMRGGVGHEDGGALTHSRSFSQQKDSLHGNEEHAASERQRSYGARSGSGRTGTRPPGT